MEEQEQKSDLDDGAQLSAELLSPPHAEEGPQIILHILLRYLAPTDEGAAHGLANCQDEKK